MAEMRRNPGRPSLLTRKKIADICNHVAAGMSIRDSAILSRLSPSTVEKWLQNGRQLKKECESGLQNDLELDEKQKLLIVLVNRVEQTQADFKEQLYSVALEQAREFRDGKMALNLLARKWPSQFGIRDQTKNTMVLVNLSTTQILDVNGRFNEDAFDAYIKNIDEGDILNRQV